MSNQPTQETVAYLLVQIAKAHRNALSVRLAEVGLYAGQELLLMQLWQQNGMSQSDLGERLQIEPPTLTKMLQRLEGCGLVERRRDAEDARICRAYLTEAGYALQAPVHRCWNAIERQILANFTLEEQVLLRRLLLQVRHNLS